MIRGERERKLNQGYEGEIKGDFRGIRGVNGEIEGEKKGKKKRLNEEKIKGKGGLWAFLHITERF